MPLARRSTIPAVLILLLAACEPGGSPADARESQTKAERPPLVRAEPIVRRQVQRKILTTSYLEAHHSVVVFARVTGRVLEVKVDEGQAVKQGQVLAVLDDREITANREQVRVQIAEKKARHELSKLEREATQHRQSQAETELKKTERDLSRLQKLDPGLVSPKDLDDAEYARSQAGDALKVAQFNTRKATLDVGVAAQIVKELESKEAEVSIKVKEHQILAPIAGVISRRMIKGGEAINTAHELFEVVDAVNLIAYLDRPQRELNLVENNQKVLFTTDAHPEQEFTARVSVISPVVDRDTGTFRIRVEVAEADSKKLRPGLFISANILTEKNRNAIMIPKTAVLSDGDDSIIFYVRNPLANRGKARRLKLDTGIEDDTSIECRNRGARSLQEGDLVIVSGHQDLKDQTEVELSKD
ncbi:MAG: efflux RND transporter periplasmic adaptor subunit [Planctomycetota bacterium]|nr:efflux RND transporter periplasmic adaptor subunit [Planctomycetota bacterium]